MKNRWGWGKHPMPSASFLGWKWRRGWKRIDRLASVVVCIFNYLPFQCFFSSFIGIKVSYLGSVQPWLVIPLITRWQFTDSGACLLASNWSLRWLARLTSRARSALWFRACATEIQHSPCFHNHNNTHLHRERDATKTERVHCLRRRGENSDISTWVAWLDAAKLAL